MYSANTGLPLIAAYDAISGKPSITLLAVHITLWLTVGMLLFGSMEKFWGALVFYIMTFVLYLIRKVTKFKIDADDKSFEVEGGDDEQVSG